MAAVPNSPGRPAVAEASIEMVQLVLLLATCIGLFFALRY
jgi:hypothetical protein